MKKIAEDLYEYKGVVVKILSSGNYVARFYVWSTGGICKVTGATQSNFKRMFNQFTRTNGGVDMRMTNEYQARNFKIGMMRG